MAPRSPRTLSNPTDEDARIFLDPVVMLGGTWALPLTLLLAAGLAALSFRRLTRLGITGGRRWFWTGMILSFGLVAYVVYRACENTRAWRALEPAEAPKRPLIIQSAA